MRKQRQQEARKLGPGTYGVRAFHEDTHGRVFMSLGKSGPRTSPEDRTKTHIPDPTAYADALDKYDAYLHQRRSPSRVGMLSSSGQRDDLRRKGGVDVPPNMYADASASTLIKPSVTHRGPFDISSGKRFHVRKRDYDLEPGHYGVVNLTPLSSSARPRTAEFSKIDRFNAKTGMRLEGELFGDKTMDPGPGYYTADLSASYPPPRTRARQRKRGGPAFGQTSGRKTVFDEVITRAQKTPTDPAEYTPRMPEVQSTTRKYKHGCGSSLRSTVGRFDFKGHTQQFAAERLTASYR